MRLHSSGCVTITNCHGWRLPPDGAQWAASKRSASRASDTGLWAYRRILLLVRMVCSISTPHPSLPQPERTANPRTNVISHAQGPSRGNLLYPYVADQCPLELGRSDWLRLPPAYHRGGCTCQSGPASKPNGRVGLGARCRKKWPCGPARMVSLSASIASTTLVRHAVCLFQSTILSQSVDIASDPPTPDSW